MQTCLPPVLAAAGEKRPARATPVAPRVGLAFCFSVPAINKRLTRHKGKRVY
jgi:hypothetical protein